MLRDMGNKACFIILLSTLLPAAADGRRPAQRLEPWDVVMTDPFGSEPERMLSLAYTENLMTFAQALADQLNLTERPDKPFVDKILDEMERSLGRMRRHFDPGPRTRQSFASIERSLDALRGESRAPQPDPRRLMGALEDILGECEMLRMSL